MNRSHVLLICALPPHRARRVQVVWFIAHVLQQERFDAVRRHTKRDIADRREQVRVRPQILLASINTHK